MQELIKSFFYILLSTCLVASVQADVLVTYYHNDLLGSPVAATDENGTLLWQEEYMPFGERVEKDPKSKNNRQWHTGKPLDEATGLTYLGARYCDSKIGRFMAMDPVGVDPVNMHSFNRYALVNNNPYKYVDPDGELAQTIPLGIVILLVAGGLELQRDQEGKRRALEGIGEFFSGLGVFSESNSEDDGDSSSSEKPLPQIDDISKSDSKLKQGIKTGTDDEIGSLSDNLDSITKAQDKRKKQKAKNRGKEGDISTLDADLERNRRKNELKQKKRESKSKNGG